MPIVKSIESFRNTGGLRYSNANGESELSRQDHLKNRDNPYPLIQRGLRFGLCQKERVSFVGYRDDQNYMRNPIKQIKKIRAKKTGQKKPSRLRKDYDEGIETINTTPNYQKPQELEVAEIRIEKEPGSHRPVENRPSKELAPKVDYKSRVDLLLTAEGLSDRYLPILPQSEVRDAIVFNKKHSKPVNVISKDVFKNLGFY